MASWNVSIAERTLREIERRAEAVGFVDPLSGRPPRGEVELTSVLCLLHQTGRIAWDDVPVLELSPSDDATATYADRGERASSVFSRSALVCSEYPVPSMPSDEWEVSGMRHDLIVLDQSKSLRGTR